MIVATHNIGIAKYYLEKDKSETAVLNLSSSYSGFGSISNLITDIPVMLLNALDINSQEFEVQYASLLMNGNMFISLANLLLAYRNNVTVVILISRDSYRDTILDMLSRFFRARYGISIKIINEMDDILYLEEDHPALLNNMNIDTDIYSYYSIGGEYEFAANPMPDWIEGALSRPKY